MVSAVIALLAGGIAHKRKKRDVTTETAGDEERISELFESHKFDQHERGARR